MKTMFCAKVKMVVIVAMATATMSVFAQKSDKENPAKNELLPPVWTYQDFLDGKIPEAKSYTIRKGHPRLFITADNKNDILDKIKAAPKLWQRIIDIAEKDKDEDMVLACGAIYQLGLAPGGKYSLSREGYGKKGVAGLMNLEISSRNKSKVRNELAQGVSFVAVPCAYDWLHDLLSEAQRKSLVERMAKAGADPAFQETFNSPRGRGMIFGLAFYGDGIDDESAKRIVEDYWKNVFWGLDTPTSNGGGIISLLLESETGSYSEGIQYFHRNYLFFLVIGAWKTATGQDYFSQLGYFRAQPYWLQHGSTPRPDTVKSSYWYTPIHRYTHFGGREMGELPVDSLMAAATGYLKDVDPKGASLAMWHLNRGRAGGIENIWQGLLFGLLMGDPRVKEASPADLAIPKRIVLRGINDVYCRSAWGDPDATVVGFANARFEGTRAGASNAFMLWKNRGGLFICRQQIARHDYCPSESYALNSPVFFDGKGLIVPVCDSGFGKGGISKAIKSDRDIGTLVCDGDSEHYDFVRGTCSGFGWATGEDNKRANIKQNERALVYLRPQDASRVDHLVILDRTDAGAENIETYVVFNTVLEPWTGRSWQEEEKGKAVLEGQWAIENAPCVIVTNEHAYPETMGGKAHARAFLKVLCPKEIKIIKVGGEEHFMDRLDGKGSDVEVFDEFRKSSKEDQLTRGGYWRFHVVPQNKSPRQTVLTVIEATDSKAAKPEGNMELLESDTLLGAQVGPNIVLFSKSGKELASGSVKAIHDGTFRIVVGDLKPEVDYTLTAGGKSFKLKSGKEAGTIFAKNVELKAGDMIKIGK